jgi:hypothetical protein
VGSGSRIGVATARSFAGPGARTFGFPIGVLSPRGAVMPSLHDDLIEREAGDLVALIDGDPARADDELAAMWDGWLRGGDFNQLLASILWCDLRVIALVASRFVRLVLPKRPKPAIVAALDTTERWARGEATLEEVWGSQPAVKALAYDGDVVAEAAAEVTGVAGQGFVGFDDEAVRSAADAMRIALGLVGEKARAQLVVLFRELVPVPTVAAFRSAHAARWAGYGT